MIDVVAFAAQHPHWGRGDAAAAYFEATGYIVHDQRLLVTLNSRWMAGYLECYNSHQENYYGSCSIKGGELITLRPVKRNQRRLSLEL